MYHSYFWWKTIEKLIITVKKLCKYKVNVKLNYDSVPDMVFDKRKETEDKNGSRTQTLEPLIKERFCER